MLIYQEFEKQVFDFLMSKHQADSSFTFSLRQKASKGAEKDYFIGTEKSNYFGVSFWNIPAGYPGSTSDLVDVFFGYSKAGNLTYKIEINHTRDPKNRQNEIVLALAKNLKTKLKEETSYFENADNKKMEYCRISSPKADYSSFEDLTIDLNTDLNRIIPKIDSEIEKIKIEYPDFIGHKITIDEFNSLLKKLEIRQGKVITINTKESNESIINHPLNTIFYGPPGTGKTYNTLIRASEIIKGNKLLDYKDAKQIFNENLGNQIEFITFHQNYSYEDFIQGLRPDTENEDGGLSFMKKDGIFKRIADRALKNSQDAEKSDFVKKDFETVFNEFIAPLLEGNELEVPMKKVSFYITFIGNKSIEFRKNYGESKHTLSIFTLKSMYESGLNNKITGGLQPYYEPILNHLLKAGQEKSQKVSLKNYVIVIDEINRANISRVFGELITLIEPEKRAGGEIPLKCTLPSGDVFQVPSNLYIIGTMNTADKSIALLDIALRRRFEFEPMYPVYKIDDEPIPDAEILKAINNRIVALKGHDFQIGHAYFMEKELSLKDKMNKKVIPLLLEYFMNDEKEVSEILKKAGLNIIEGVWPIQVS